MRRLTLIGTFVVLGGLLLAVAAALTQQTPGDHRDEVFKRASTWADSVSSYTQHASIDTTINERPFAIESTRSIHPFQNTSSSTITTSVELAEPAGTHTYTVNNRRTTADIYTRVQTRSEALEPRIPVTNGWRHFKHGEVTQRFRQIAPTGHVVDPLALFRDGAAALRVLQQPTATTYNGTSTHRYVLTLGEQATVPRGASSLASHMRRGTTSVWVSTDVARIQRLRVKAPQYSSTISFTDFSTVATITPPVAPARNRTRP